jgi:hypothetical protein
MFAVWFQDISALFKCPLFDGLRHIESLHALFQAQADTWADTLKFCMQLGKSPHKKTFNILQNMKPNLIKFPVRKL